MEYKTLKDINLKNKLVLLRIDINSEVVNGKVKDNLRFKEHARTINFLLSKNARVVIIAHQSRPGYTDFTDLSQHTVILNKYINGKNKIKFVNDIIGNKAIEEIELLNNGEVILLDNIRKLKDEFNP